MVDDWKIPISNILKNKIGLEPRDFRTINGNPGEDSIQKDCLSVELPIRLFPNPVLITSIMRMEISDPAYLVFLGSTKNKFSEKDHTIELVVARGKGQEDIIRLAQTSAPNYGLDTNGVISEIEKLYDHAEIEILGADVDSVSIQVTELKTCLVDLSQKFFEVCSDLCKNDKYSDEITLENYLKRK